MVLTEHARAHSPLKPSYPGSRGRYGGTHHRRRYYRQPYRQPHRSPYYRQQPIYVIQEQPSYNVPVSHWWYPNSWNTSNWYPSSWFHEGFQMERNMNCSMLSILCLLILIGYCSKNK
jgi:hypothetical protein